MSVGYYGIGGKPFISHTAEYRSVPYYVRVELDRYGRITRAATVHTDTLRLMKDLAPDWIGEVVPSIWTRMNPYPEDLFIDEGL